MIIVVSYLFSTIKKHILYILDQHESKYQNLHEIHNPFLRANSHRKDSSWCRVFVHESKMSIPWKQNKSNFYLISHSSSYVPALVFFLFNVAYFQQLSMPNEWHCSLARCPLNWQNIGVWSCTRQGSSFIWYLKQHMHLHRP